MESKQGKCDPSIVCRVWEDRCSARKTEYGRDMPHEVHTMCGQKKQKTKKAVQPREIKAQPKEEVKVERDVRRTVKMIMEV